MENYTEPTPIQRRELSMLSRPSKALLRNKLAILRGNDQLTADDDRSNPGARSRSRTNLRVIDEILGYFEEPTPVNCRVRSSDGHCGATETQGREG